LSSILGGKGFRKGFSDRNWRESIPKSEKEKASSAGRIIEGPQCPACWVNMGLEQDEGKKEK